MNPALPPGNLPRSGLPTRGILRWNPGGYDDPQEWSRWGPWLLKNIFSSSKNGPYSVATESEWTSPINDERER
jgi:hypothetical protein